MTTLFSFYNHLIFFKWQNKTLHEYKGANYNPYSIQDFKASQKKNPKQKLTLCFPLSLFNLLK